MNAGCAGKTVRSLENACHTWAPRSRRGAIQIHVYLYLYLSGICYTNSRLPLRVRFIINVVEWFQRNLAQVISMWVAIAEKVFEVTGQRSKVKGHSETKCTFAALAWCQGWLCFSMILIKLKILIRRDCFFVLLLVCVWQRRHWRHGDVMVWWQSVSCVTNGHGNCNHNEQRVPWTILQGIVSVELHGIATFDCSVEHEENTSSYDERWLLTLS